jgi:Secretion system C-terminal sorting domain
MKINQLLLSFFMFFSTCLSAQKTYIPMLKPNHSWKIDYANFNLGSVYSVKIGKDSIIKGLKYNLLDHEYLREDSAQSKVFIYKNGKEQVLYNFNLKVGDTMFYNQSCFYVIKEITSVKLADSVSKTLKYRLAYKGFASYNKYWYMGIGSSNGPTFAPSFGCQSDPTYKLVDFSIDGKSLYNVPFSVSDNTIPEIEETLIYPNPLYDDLLNINLPTSLEITTLRIYDAFGKIHLSANNIPNNLQFNFTILPKGLYFLEFEDKNARKGVKKLLKM